MLTLQDSPPKLEEVSADATHDQALDSTAALNGHAEASDPARAMDTGEEGGGKEAKQVKDATALPPATPSLRPSVAPADGGPTGAILPAGIFLGA